jgi:signal transduction histidine kinase
MGHIYTFVQDSYYYLIRDQHGAVAESTLPGSTRDTKFYSIEVTNLTYRRLVPPGAEPSAEVVQDSYYDQETGTYVEFEYEYVALPPYTVELYLLPGATPENTAWSVLEIIWSYRGSLFYVLGASLLIFAAAMVYLCCAAGRDPRKEGIRAGGMNRIPLDLYALGSGSVIICTIFAAIEGVDYFRVDAATILNLAFFALFFGCLTFVGFCFGCVAQFKTPGGFWWRNSLIGRGLHLLVLGWKAAPTALKWLSTAAKRMLKAIWWPFGSLIRFAVRKFVQFYGMLPRIWQFLAAGAVLLMLALLTFAVDHDFWRIVCIGLFGAIVFYGAWAFGVLCDGAKRMRRGDLDSQIHTPLLIGSFREFAGELNGLADVVTTAAQDKLKSERMKTELITNVSHDIKTPLTSIINYVDLMEKPHTPEEQDAYLEVLSRQSQRLKKLIDDLMEMSKASTGNLSVEIMDIDAAEAIHQALGEFGDKLEKAKLTPVVRTPETQVIMKADGKLLWRVLSNLLSNAVKYAQGGTRLYIDLLEVDGKAVISLKNISRDELNVSAEELMERFVRGDASRNTEGSGLGLNIAQSLMELQKGQLQLLVDGDLFKVTLTFPTV